MPRTAAKPTRPPTRRARPTFAADERITLADAADWLGRRRAGRPTHPVTVRAWATAGLRGVRLQTELAGGIRLTTVAWLREFFQRVEVARTRERERLPSEARADRTPARRVRDNERARRELEAKGV